jgi:hypothetical protein
MPVYITRLPHLLHWQHTIAGGDIRETSSSLIWAPSSADRGPHTSCSCWLSLWDLDSGQLLRRTRTPTLCAQLEYVRGLQVGKGPERRSVLCATVY